MHVCVCVCLRDSERERESQTGVSVCVEEGEKDCQKQTCIDSLQAKYQQRTQNNPRIEKLIKQRRKAKTFC